MELQYALSLGSTKLSGNVSLWRSNCANTLTNSVDYISLLNTGQNPARAHMLIGNRKRDWCKLHDQICLSLHNPKYNFPKYSKVMFLLIWFYSVYTSSAIACCVLSSWYLQYIAGFNIAISDLGSFSKTNGFTTRPSSSARMSNAQSSKPSCQSRGQHH